VAGFSNGRHDNLVHTHLTSTEHEEGGIDKGGHVADVGDRGRVFGVMSRASERFCSTGKGEPELKR
jgi:hypothetical protein